MSFKIARTLFVGNQKTIYSRLFRSLEGSKRNLYLNSFKIRAVVRFF